MKALALLGLGSKYWNMKATLAALPNEVAIQVFDGAPGLFGDPRKHLSTLCTTGKVKAAEIQLTYDSNHTLVTLDWMRSRLPLWEAFAKAFPKVQFFISHTTEHREQDPSKLMQRMNLIRSLSPSCVPVNNPMPGGALLPHEVNETHTNRPLDGSYIASMDGFDTLGKGNVLGWDSVHRKALFNYAWSGLCNLNDGNQGGLPPSQRKAAPGEKHLRMLSWMSEFPGNAPNVFPGAKEIKRPLLWKPMSQGTNDAREGKPALISNCSAGKLHIITKDKEVLGDMIRPSRNLGTFTGGLYRHYAGWAGGINKWGYEIASLALKKSGSQWVWFTDGKKIWGPVVPWARRGFFA